MKKQFTFIAIAILISISSVYAGEIYILQLKSGKTMKCLNVVRGVNAVQCDADGLLLTISTSEIVKLTKTEGKVTKFSPQSRIASGDRLSGGSSHSPNEKYSSSNIRTRCEEEWGTDYPMVKYCIERQSSAKRDLGAVNSPAEIKQRCEDEWGTDYPMVKYCIERQSSAKRDLRTINPSAEIKQRCEDEWGTDYPMVKYCIERQSNAKRDLGK